MNRIGANLPNGVEIPAGDFLMGAQREDSAQPNYDRSAAFRSESPVHKVRLSRYRMAKFPVTVAEFQRFVDAGGYTTEVFWQAGGFTLHREPKDWAEQLENPDRPVTWVSWYAASAYAAWANCRLPTEAEWERAARGTEARKYPWGNLEPDPALLNFGASSIRDATPVGAYPDGATPEGIFDMEGNVKEWCQDRYGGYKADDQVDPRGPAKGKDRVLRGSYRARLAYKFRSAGRSRALPDFRFPDIGFRVVSGALQFIKQPVRTAEATPSVKQPATPALVNWVEIPAGDFLMGAQHEDSGQPNYDSSAFRSESPVHKVHLSAYRIAKFPVTVAEFQRFVDAGGYTNEAYWQAGGFGLHEGPAFLAHQLKIPVEDPDRPVIWVSWYAAWANCRLPTEAEWERAARGTEARKYPWGNRAPRTSYPPDNRAPRTSLLNFANNINHATSVSAYPNGATPEGVFEMAGNVDELCHDWYGDYKADDQVDPRGPAEGQNRVLRGGSWHRHAIGCRSASRVNGHGPDNRSNFVGFRVVSGVR